jgi:hypothetical protein
MDYHIWHADEYPGHSKQGNKFAPKWPFRLLVSGSSDSGKTTMIMNLLMGNKKIKEDGERYILCDDVVLIGKHLDEPKWNIVKNFFDELAKEGEDVSFKAFPATEIPDIEDFDSSRATVVIFEDLMNVSNKIQKCIADYFSSGRHSNISSIYVSQRYFLTHKTIRENVNYTSLHRGAGSLSDIKRIVSQFTEHSDRIVPVIDDITRKKEFIVFDHRRPRDDPLSVRIRWDTSFWMALKQTSSSKIVNKDNSDTISDNLDHGSSMILDNSDSISDHPSSILDHPKQSSKFNPWGRKLLKDAKINGTLIDIAKNMPSPADRKKMMSRDAQVKNSIDWAKYVYREAFDMRDKTLGPDWVKFANKLK